ncbi:DUF2625 domain-containing protein [Flavobacterium branchiophilum]|uniref:DUF2625 domain-containing protein n=1 Tax=Flavobacterium branchiophilum (strain FL-15) TaxID=1034807 RepID=G2YZX7_FLABF|nr:DUF2625 domain-containing protein [Flavobacterium branchiophilum]CCB69232.1 Hypothetical protein precursor [Flavobacterium branchiophilum FL-15]
MHQKHIIIIFLLSISPLLAQYHMKNTNELINHQESAWPSVKDWIAKAKNHVTILATDSINARQALYNTQVTTRSPMGAIIFNTGGLMVDQGWIRILGSGNEKLTRSFSDWNKGKAFSAFGNKADFLLIADDAVGGFFVLNGGKFDADLGKVYYFSPDNLQYEPLDMTYTDFLNFCFNANLDQFYKNLRWPNWQKEVSTLHGDSVFSFYPYLWSQEGQHLQTNTKKIVPIEEQYFINLSFRKQLGLDD